MATQPNHFRSISFPSRSSKSKNFQSHIQNLKSLETNLNSEAIQSALLDLAELHNSVQEALAQSQNSQKTIIFHQNTNSSIEQSLSASVDFLDVCSSIRDLTQMIRENVQALQSAIRRKGLDFSNIENEMNSYSSFRKRANKFAAKTIKPLKNMENKNGSNLSSPVDENGSFAGALSELSGLTIAILKSTLVFLSCPAGKSGGWNLISRLVDRDYSHNNRGFISEVRRVDSLLSAVRSGDSKIFDVNMVLMSLQNLDECVEGIEAGMQRLFRQLLQNRVTLLNFVTDH